MVTQVYFDANTLIECMTLTCTNVFLYSGRASFAQVRHLSSSSTSAACIWQLINAGPQISCCACGIYWKALMKKHKSSSRHLWPKIQHVKVLEVTIPRADQSPWITLSLLGCFRVSHYRQQALTLAKRSNRLKATLSEFEYTVECQSKELAALRAEQNGLKEASAEALREKEELLQRWMEEKSEEADRLNKYNDTQERWEKLKYESCTT